MNAPLAVLSPDWLTRVCQSVFESSHLSCEPFVLSGHAPGPVAAFDWSRLEAVLAGKRVTARSRASWHYCDERQFIVQVAGEQNYYFRPNTVTADRPASAETIASYAAEDSRLWMASLSAGDVLYLPARWWRKADCVEDSLTIELGRRAGESQPVPRSALVPADRVHSRSPASLAPKSDYQASLLT